MNHQITIRIKKPPMSITHAVVSISNSLFFINEEAKFKKCGLKGR